MSKEKKKSKGTKYKRFSLDERQCVMLLAFLRQCEHDDAKDEVAYGIVQTLEGLGEKVEGDEEVKDGEYRYEDGADVVISVEAHEYLPTRWRQCKPIGLMLSTWIGLKKAVANAETVYDKKLSEEGWKQVDDLWFPGDGSGDSGDDEVSAPEEVEEDSVEAPAEGEEAPAEEPVLAAVDD